MNGAEEPRKAILLSCDPGHDDAMAIILAGSLARHTHFAEPGSSKADSEGRWLGAGHHPGLQVLGIDTVAANQSVGKVTRNALQVLDAAGLGHISVVQGQARPLLRPPLDCPEIHGDSGLALRSGSLPPTNLQPRPGKAVLVMYEWLATYHRDSGRKAHVVCTAALTNVALLLILFPEAAGLIEQIVLMGGAIGLGNTSAAAEFNIQVDPEAAKVVFESGLPVVMVPLEVTHTALATPAVLQRIAGDQPSRFRALVREVLLFFADTYRTVFGFEHPPIHDPCAVAYVAAPELFQVERMRVDVETGSALTAGRTVCDVHGRSSRPPNVGVARAMDVPRFWELMTAAIHAADRVSPLNAVK